MNKSKISGGVAHRLPEDLRKTLASDAKALALWEDITPLARNEWICWTISVQKPETRKEHVARVRTELKEGMRRPCCWIGCTHRKDKPISRSVQYVLSKRSKSRNEFSYFLSQRRTEECLAGQKSPARPIEQKTWKL